MTSRHFAALGIALLASGALGSNCHPTKYESRPAGTDGTARWALAIAQPVISSFAPDAELREVLGSQIFLDGRLPANGGDWSFAAYSPAMSMTIQVTVDFDGKTTMTTRADAAPGPGIQVPLTASWADSSTVFAATDGHRDAAATIANLVALNVSSYPSAAGQAVWAIDFDTGANQLVSATGMYIGPQ
jgi:hypothetical protein